MKVLLPAQLQHKDSSGLVQKMLKACGTACTVQDIGAFKDFWGELLSLITTYESRVMESLIWGSTTEGWNRIESSRATFVPTGRVSVCLLSDLLACIFNLHEGLRLGKRIHSQHLATLNAQLDRTTN